MHDTGRTLGGLLHDHAARPEKANALTEAMLEALASAVLVHHRQGPDPDR
jgi:hypothetical protein